MSTPTDTPIDSTLINPDRRKALKFGGLAIGFLWLGGGKAALAAINPLRQSDDAAVAAADGHPAFAPNAFVCIDTDGKVRLVMPNVEMGQSIYTGTAMLLAEELGVDLAHISVEHAPSNAQLYGTALLGGEQATGGSTSTRNGWESLRQAGAVARLLLVQAAAAQWKVAADSCTVEHGEVVHGASGRRLGYGALAAAAGKLPMPSGAIPLKDPAHYTLIGKPWRRVDAAIKVNGEAQFGIDVKVPGMKIATVRACPVFGGKLASVDDSRARALPGVVAVIKLDDAVAVIGDHYWAALQGLQALEISWDLGANAHLDTAELTRQLDEHSRTGKPIVARKQGQRPAAGKSVEAIYQLPLLAHATMEPLNATVHVSADQCEIWLGTQVPNRVVAAAVKLTGLPEEKIIFHNFFLGGGFGRRLEADIAVQAIKIAKQVNYPVKVIWSREEDVRQEIPRPMYYDRISAVLDPDGRPDYWSHRTTGASVAARWIPAALSKDGLDSDTVECAAETPYAVPNVLSEWVPCDLPQGLLPGWWRGVGPTHNLFVVESFMDELAHAAGQDPLAYRRALLQKNPRALAVLDLAAEKIGWGKGSLPPGVGRGIALGEPFGSAICAIVEAEVTAEGSVRMRRVVVGLDCGQMVNPSSVSAQVQGGLLFGFSAALYNGLTVKNGGIVESNFNDYRNLRINETPAIELHVVQTTASPGGMGEVGTAIAAPALANAVFAACGVRVRNLPIERALAAHHEEARKAVARRKQGDRAEALT